MARNEPGRPAFINPHPGHCRTCDVAVPGKRQYCDDHRPAKAPPQRNRSKATRIADAHARRGAAGVASEVVVPIRAGGSVGGAPSSGEWDDALGKAAVAATWLYALRITRGEPRDARGHLAVELAMTDDEATSLTHPLAARLSGTSINRRYGRTIIETLGLIEPVTAVMAYVDRMHEYQFNRAQRERAGAPPPAYLPTPPPAPPVRQEAAAHEHRPDHAGDDVVDPAAAAAVPAPTGFTGGPFGALG